MGENAAIWSGVTHGREQEEGQQHDRSYVGAGVREVAVGVVVPQIRTGDGR